MRGLKAWWNQADEYEWMTAFLRQRGWLRSAQWMMVVVAGSFHIHIEWRLAAVKPA